MDPDDITNRTFFKKLQIILTDLISTFHDFIKDSIIGDERGCNYCFNSNMFDDYLFHRIEAHIIICCKRTSQDEYLVTIPTKNNLEDKSTIIKINGNNNNNNNNNKHFLLYTLFNFILFPITKYRIHNSMRTINPKCTNEDSFKYSILISLYYYELNNHKERINQLKKYLNKYDFTYSTYTDFENNNPYISIRVYDQFGQLLHKSLNNTNNKAYIVKLNNHRYYALKTNQDKYIRLKELLKQFTHK